jgi:hypothetical protein
MSDVQSLAAYLHTALAWTGVPAAFAEKVSGEVGDSEDRDAVQPRPPSDPKEETAPALPATAL